MDRLERSGPQPEGKFDRQQQQIFDLPPWVYVKNLASKSLSLAARRIRSDWQKRYAYSPVLLETFVDPTKYKGTCYRAANWLFLGQTAGRGRMDRYKRGF